MAEVERRFVVGWAQMDGNGHMRNSAFLDLCSDSRMLFFAGEGVTAADFARLRIGPVIARDELQYLKEIRLLDEVRVTLAAAGHSADGSRFRLRNELFRPDGVLAARVTSDGGWLDLGARRLVTPPPELLAAMGRMPRTADFTELPGSVR